MRTRSLLGVVSVLFIATGAAAQTAPAASAHPSARPDAGPHETAEQREFRKNYVTATNHKQTALLAGLVWTPEVHKAAAAHWGRAYRALRVRELAEDAKDAKTVTSADALLRKVDAHYFALLAELAPTLPKVPAAPAISAPAAGASVAIGSALSIAATPAAGVTADATYCTVYDGHQAYWNNYDPKTKAYGACTFPADAPQWSRFSAGKAWLSVHTITNAKSPKGTPYKMWSHARVERLELTGGAAKAVAK